MEGKEETNSHPQRRTGSNVHILGNKLNQLLLVGVSQEGTFHVYSGVDVYSPHDENKMKRQKFHQNMGMKGHQSSL